MTIPKCELTLFCKFFVYPSTQCVLKYYFIINFISSVHDVAVWKETQFVRLVLEAVSRLLDFLPVRQGFQHVTSFERALLTTEKTKQMESISTVSTRDSAHRHPVQQLMRFVSNAKDAMIVSFAVRTLSRLIVLQQPSLMSVAKDDADEFIQSVFWLLQNSKHEYVRVDLWRFLALCDSKQPRLLDLFINLKFNSEKKQVGFEKIFSCHF